MAQNQFGQSLGAMLGQFAFGGADRKSAMKGMLDGARAGAYDASAKNSLASALKNEAEAAQVRAENESRNPANLLRNAMTGYGVPTDEAGAVENFLRSGRLGGKYEPAIDGFGPAMPAPAWASKLPDVARSMQGIQNALTIGDKSSKSIADAGAINREARLKDDVMAGRLDPTKLAQAEYAGKGSAPFQFSEFGTGNNLTGTLDESTGAARNFAGKRKSETAQNMAQANSANALATQRQTGGSGGGKGGGRAPMGYRYTANEDGDVVLEPIPGGPKDPSNAPPPKPMPSTALKMQQEELDAIGMASSTDADLGVIAQQLETGKLPLGPVSNLTNKARNFAGQSTEASRNLASFSATLEKLRNDSLRLNKGVQTDGDSQRAWNELVTNINDPKVVKQRLAEVRAINKRAVDLRKMNVETIRSNFGQPPLDTSGQTSVAPAIGTGKTSSAATNQPPAASPAGGAYDADKEKRYQEWKARQAK